MKTVSYKIIYIIYFLLLVISKFIYFLQDFPNNLQMKIQTEKILQNFIEITNF